MPTRDRAVFSYHLLNSLQGDRRGAAISGFAYGFLAGLFLPFAEIFRCAARIASRTECIEGAGWVILYAILAAATAGVSVAIHMKFTLVLAVVVGALNVIASEWSSTRGSLVTDPARMRVKDAFDYARGWTLWGAIGYGILASDPQIYNEQLASEVTFE